MLRGTTNVATYQAAPDLPPMTLESRSYSVDGGPGDFELERDGRVLVELSYVPSVAEIAALLRTCITFPTKRAVRDSLRLARQLSMEA